LALCLPLNADPIAFGADLSSAFGFNTNPYVVLMDDVAGGGSFAFRLKPSFDFQARADFGQFDAKLNGNAATFFGFFQQTRIVLSDASLLLDAQLFPNSPASLLFDTTISTSRHVENLFVDSLTELKADIRLGTRFRPANGAITILAEGEAKNQSFFDIDQPTSGKYTDDPNKLFNDSYYGHVRLGWDLSHEFELFLNAKYGVWHNPSTANVVSLTPLFVDLGVASDISPNIHGTLSAGYANNFIRLVATNTLLGGASLPFSVAAKIDWAISKDSHFQLKLARELDPAPLFLEIYTNTIEAQFRHKFWNRFQVCASPYLRLYEYGKPLAADNSGRLAGNHRNDFVVGLAEEVSYRLTDWLSLGVNHQGTFRWSSAADLQIFTDAGKLASDSGNFVTSMNSNEFLVFAKLEM